MLHLEYMISFWLPSCKNDIELLERGESTTANHKADTIVKGTTIGEAAQAAQLFTLGEKRLRRDLMHVFIHLKKFSTIDHSE